MKLTSILRKYLLFFWGILFATSFVQAVSIKFEKTPELAGKSIIFVVHKQFIFEHHNTENIYQYGEINDVLFKKVGGNSGLWRADFDENGFCKSTKLLVHSENGIIRDPDI